MHIPVLLNEVKNYLLDQNLSVEANGYNIFFDATLGGGGYTKAILDSSLNNKIVATDLDPKAIQVFLEEFENDPKYKNRFTLKNTDFSQGLQDLEDFSLNGIVADLGFSSNQLDGGGRGFSYRNDYFSEPFDLRFNPNQNDPAYISISKLESSNELGEIIFKNSGEDLAFVIARKLFDLCKNSSETINVEQVVNLILSTIPAKFFMQRNSILSRVWQAIRIWVNSELDILEEFLPLAFSKLKPNGRLVIVTFHSLEDKIVTKWMRKISEPIKDEIYGNATFKAKLITKKAILPTAEEINFNPRSRSAGLRCLEKTGFDK